MNRFLRLATFDKPCVIACGEHLPRHLSLPRDCLAEGPALLEKRKVRPVVRDERAEGTPIDTMFHSSLRPVQDEAVAKICSDSKRT